MTPIVIILGDNRWTLRRLPDASIDAVVCDPPYGLGKEPDMVEVLGHWLAGDDYTATGGGFMGKSWDSFVPGPATWREVLRVLKPGGHLLAFAGARTVDVMGLAIRLGGFDIRDCLSWLYGSGFPKSLDVSKAIDKAAGAERTEVIGSKSVPQGHAFAGETYGGDSHGILYDITAPATAAAAWSGWGTALKPAWEPIIVARKPLIGTVAANVLAHGTGAINVDGCRIGATGGTRSLLGSGPNHLNEVYGEGMGGLPIDPSARLGRWPANVVLDEVAAELLDEQTGVLKSGDPVAGPHELMGYSGADVVEMPEVKGDKGGASRFFYVAKASKSERNAGCGNLESQITNEQTPPGARGDAAPRAGANRSGAATNHHPTVKPIALMRWLVRLVTPPGGVVLDPFLGSGTTGIAAVAEGFGFVGMEQSAEYVAIAEARIRHHAAEVGREVKVLDFNAEEGAA